MLRTFFWRCPKVASLNGSSNQDLLNTLLTLNRRTLDEVIGERGFTYSGTVFSDFALIGINFIAGASWLGWRRSPVSGGWKIVGWKASKWKHKACFAHPQTEGLGEVAEGNTVVSLGTFSTSTWKFRVPLPSYHFVLSVVANRNSARILKRFPRSESTCLVLWMAGEMALIGWGLQTEEFVATVPQFRRLPRQISMSRPSMRKLLSITISMCILSAFWIGLLISHYPFQHKHFTSYLISA